MGTYSELSAFATNNSALVSAMNTRFAAVRSLERGNVEPTAKVAGQLWLRTDYPTLGDAVQMWTGSVWQFLIDPNWGQINSGGTVEYAADQPMAGFKITGLGAPGANGDAARLEDAYADYQGRHRYIAATTIQDEGAPTTSYQVVGFVPREITLRLYGDVIKQSDASVLGSIDQELHYRRWDADAGAGFGGTGGKTAVWSGTIGAETITVYIEPRYTAGTQGFFLSIEDGSGDRYDVEMAQSISQFGLNN